MKNRIICCLLVMFFWGGLVSCGDFLEETSQNLAYVSKVKDLDELLMGEVYDKEEGFSPVATSMSGHLMGQTRYYFAWIHLLDDDVTEFATEVGKPATLPVLEGVRSSAAAAYEWKPQPLINRKGVRYEDAYWRKIYRHISVANSIIFQLEDMRSSEKDVELCDRVEGEARFLRAYYYFWLVNIYAHPYNKATASEEPGVPLKLEPAVEDRYFSRASVQEVYDQVLVDLKRASECFKGIHPTRPVKAGSTATHLLLSRVSLYMEDYEQAIGYADSVIANGKYRMLDLNAHVVGASFTYELSPETIFTQGGYIMSLVHADDYALLRQRVDAYTSSVDLLGCYQDGDLRRKVFFTTPRHDKTVQRCLKLRKVADGRISDYMLFRLPEAYLNKAEAQALLGDESGAKTTLNLLRAKRFADGQMPSIEDGMAETGESLVNFVRSERRRELCYEGHRWFDLRRYAVNSVAPFTKSIRHLSKSLTPDQAGNFADVGEYVLKPYPEDREAYVFPLPDYAVLFNDGVLIQNAPRPERKMIPFN